MDPKSLQADFKRGSANLSKRNFDAAIDDLSKAIELNPTYDNAYLKRGAAYAEKKEYDKALADLTHFIDSKPAVPDGYRQRARVYDLMNNKELADKDRRTLTDLGVKYYIRPRIQRTRHSNSSIPPSTRSYSKIKFTIFRSV